MNWTKWRLRHAWQSDRVLEGFNAIFERVSDDQKHTEMLTISVEHDGLTKAYINEFIETPMRPHKRAQLHALCCQAVAYYELTGSVEGFPEQELL